MLEGSDTILGNWDTNFSVLRTDNIVIPTSFQAFVVDEKYLRYCYSLTLPSKKTPTNSYRLGDSKVKMLFFSKCMSFVPKCP